MDFDDLDDAVGGRPYDIVIYGATGYSGCLLVEYLDWYVSEQDESSRIRWAIGGRDKKKLDKISRNCKTTPAVLVASGREELMYVAEVTSVLISAAGPYMLCGTDVCAACVEKGTHYVDITGEMVWMKRIITAYDEKCREKGIMMIQCAGMMCAPNDICLYLLAQKYGALKQYREYQCEGGIGGGGGTFFSGYAGYDKMLDSELEVLLDPFTLGGIRKCGRRKVDEDEEEAVVDEVFPKLHCAPGHSTPCVARFLRRTCQLFEREKDAPVDDADAPLEYGEELQVKCRYGFGTMKDAEARARTSKEPKDIRQLIKHAKTMEDAVKRGQFAPPGGGPTTKARGEGFMKLYSVVETVNGEWAHCFLDSCDAYEVTAMCSVMAAIVIIEEPDKIHAKQRGGVVGPAYALHGSTYAERLQSTCFCGDKSRRMKFEIKDGKPSEEAMLKTFTWADNFAKEVFNKSMKGQLEGSWAMPELLS